MPELDVSIIVVSFNTRDLTRACLQSISDHCQALNYEVIVVDNASADGSSEMVTREFPEIRLLANSENLGFARANNQAFEIATGRFLLLLNPDAEVRENTVQACLEFAETRPDAGAIGCRAHSETGEQQSTLFRHLRPHFVLINTFVPNRLTVKSKLLGRARYVGLDLDQVQEVEVVAGCFMLVRREVLEQVGGMDGEFFMYAEESEWCFRMRQAGFKNLYFPGAAILHYGGRSAEQSIPQMTENLCRGQLLFIQKTQGRGAAWISNLLMLCRDLPRLVPWTLAGLLGRKRREQIRTLLAPSMLRLPLLLRGLWYPDWGLRGRDASGTARGD